MSISAKDSSPIERFLKKHVWTMLVLTPIGGILASASLYLAHLDLPYPTRVALTYMFAIVVPMLMMVCMLYMLFEGLRNKPYLHIAAAACGLFVIEAALKFSGLIVLSMVLPQ